MGWPADVAASAHLFVDPAAGLADTVDVGGENGHHLARVLRLRVGEIVTAADGSGGWRPYRVAAVGADLMVRLDATAGPEREPVLIPALAVAFALTKGDKPAMVVQILIERGHTLIVQVVSTWLTDQLEP